MACSGCTGARLLPRHAPRRRGMTQRRAGPLTMPAHGGMRPQVQANSLPCKPAAATAAGRRSAHGRRADLDARTRQVVQERGDDRGRVAGVHKRRMDQVHAHHCVAQAPPHMRSRAHAMTSTLSGRLTLAESHVRGWHDNHDLTLHGRSQSWHVCGVSGATCQVRAPRCTQAEPCSLGDWLPPGRHQNRVSMAAARSNSR